MRRRSYGAPNHNVPFNLEIFAARVRKVQAGGSSSAATKSVEQVTSVRTYSECHLSSHQVVLSEISPLIYLRHVAEVSSGAQNAPESTTNRKSAFFLTCFVIVIICWVGLQLHHSCNMAHIALLQGVFVACFLVDN